MLNCNAILRFLGTCSQYRISADARVAISRTKKIEWALLGCGFALFALAVAVGGWHKLFHQPFSPCLRQFASGVACLSMLSSISVLMVGPIIGVRRLCKRNRKHELTDGILEEISNDEAAILVLLQYTTESLNYASHWLRQKVDRIARQIGPIFGEPAAALALLGLAGGLVKDLGSFHWIVNTFLNGISAGNALNVAIVGALALCFGFSLGAIALKFNRNHYQYQLELIDSALKFKELSEQSAALDSATREVRGGS